MLIERVFDVNEKGVPVIQTVSLFSNGPVTTNLGFGTASLMGRLGRSASLRLLERAYGEGIRYFDTAPAYGFGEVEEVVGRFARSRRASIVLTTKFGLVPSRANRWMKFGKRLARPVLALSPALRKRARSSVGAALQPVARFDVADARRSLDDSLRSLRTQYIDILLLHECRITDLRNESLLSMLQEAQSAGKIRAFGIGTDMTTIEEALHEVPAFTRVLQFANNAAAPNLQRLDIASGQVCITHSPFGGVGRTFATLGAGTPLDRSRVADALLRYAVRANSKGVVLFSAQREEYIVGNVRALSAPADDDATLLQTLRFNA